ncbi:MAG TPA: IclR family transcriptional regulator [Phycicoccus sp.]|jgi:IclR family acetate operon transcriptional repressor|nr:IclR family transcriptional regulator [Phycicoccus sp.]HQK32871.1 IclR family transcriptional regulator [Phycicoccus sp.]HQY98060.1 IclR family transcriptional regulator [Phycicoccus sp.]
MVKRTEDKASGGVQSIDRTFAILEALADAGGLLSLSQLAERADLPLATIHRLVRTLVQLGYVRQEENRQYSLGPRLLRLSDTTTKRVGVWAEPYMEAAVAELQESVNLAMLDGDEIVYIAQVQPQHNFMRMFTEVGRRVLPHSTAVGKAMLASEDPALVRGLLHRTGMPRRTDTTITHEDAFIERLAADRLRGYSTDEGEQEVGVRCVAVAVPGAPRPMALSMSGPTTRVDEAKVEQAARILGEAARGIADALANPARELSA